MLIEKIETTATFEDNGQVVAEDVPVVIRVTQVAYVCDPEPSSRPQKLEPRRWHGEAHPPAAKYWAFRDVCGGRSRIRIRLAEGRSGDIIITEILPPDSPPKARLTLAYVSFRGTGALA